MVVEQKFIDRIESLRHNTKSRICELQKNTCPMVKSIYMNYQFEYWYDGYKYNLWEDNMHLYAVNELPYCYDNELKNTTFIETADVLISESKMWPFLLFIDGVVIQWSKITVIHDYDYSYIKIADIYPDYSFTTRMVVFPIHYNKIRYGEDNDIITTFPRKGFYFGTDGKRLQDTTFQDIILRLEILDDNIFYQEQNLTLPEGSIVEFKNLPDGFIPTSDNILVFNKDGSFNNNGSAGKLVDLYDGNFGMFVIEDEDYRSPKWAIFMYNLNSEKVESSMYNKMEDLDRDTILSLLKNNKDKESDIWKDVIAPLINTFDFDHDISLTYDKNIFNAVKYITRYNFSLWKDQFTNDLPIQSLHYTGLEFKLHANDKGFVQLSRKHTDLIEDTVIVFVNHKIYQYMIDVVYTSNTINIPIFGIQNTDHVELLKFSKCNNYILNITVENKDTPVYIHSEYNLDDCDIMSEECPDVVYSTPTSEEKRKQYIVDYTYTKDGDNYKITFTNEYYYGKQLKIVPKHQFRYYRFKQNQGQFKIILPTQFNYCHNIDQYLVFVNGKKIDKSEFTITIMNKYRPFDKLILYLSTILDTGDYIDIFYIPEVIVEKYKASTLSNKGQLLLEDQESSINYPNTYPFSKDTSLIFINGLKVNPLDIRDISLNSVLIDVDKYVRDSSGNITYDGQGNPITKPYYVDSLVNVNVMEYVIGDKQIAGFLKGLYEQLPSTSEYDPSLIDFNHTSSDDWKDLINTLQTKYKDDGGIEKIFGKIYEIEDPAESYKNNFASLKNILYDAIIDYYLSRDDVSTNGSFVYDFESEYFDKDTNDIRIINLVPDKDKLLNYYTNDNMATTDDVLLDQIFIPAT